MSKLNLKDYGVKEDDIRKKIGQIEIYEFNKEVKDNILKIMSETSENDTYLSFSVIRELIKKTTNFGDSVDELTDEVLDYRLKNNRDLELMIRELTIMIEEIVEDMWYKQTQDLKSINSMLNIILKSSDVAEINNKLNKILKKNKVKSIEELISKNDKK